MLERSWLICALKDLPLYSEYAAVVATAADWILGSPEGMTERSEMTSTATSMMTVVVDAGKKRSPRKSRTKLPSPNSDIQGDSYRTQGTSQEGFLTNRSIAYVNGTCVQLGQPPPCSVYSEEAPGFLSSGPS